MLDALKNYGVTLSEKMNSIQSNKKGLPTRNIKTPTNDWCKDTGRYEPKSRLIKISSSNFYLRHGKGGLGFILFERKGFTIVNIYKMKDKKFVSSSRFNRKIGFKSAREYIFDHSEHVAIAVRETSRPFKTILRSKIISLSRFKETFKPNEFSRKSYAASIKDMALMSLSGILKRVEPVEFAGGTHSASIAYATRFLKNKRLNHDGEFPAVEIFAIWSNFNPDTRLVSEKKYDRGEPLFYSYEIIKDLTT